MFAGALLDGRDEEDVPATLLDARECECSACTGACDGCKGDLGERGLTLRLPDAKHARRYCMSCLTQLRPALDALLAGAEALRPKEGDRHVV